MIQAKKYLGQHFLKSKSISKKITKALFLENSNTIVEIGPGMGALTKFLVKKEQSFFAIEKDREAVDYLIDHQILKKNQIIEGNFLKWNPKDQNLDSFALIGNFPYNISSQIIFRLLELKSFIPECVGMFQKEVALRLASKEGNKIYGKTSIFLQAFYEVEYLFELTKEHFSPPPKVDSTVLRLQRKKIFLSCNEKIFFRLVKTAFLQRRKTLRNALKSMNFKKEFYQLPLLDKRPETLSVNDFINLTQIAQNYL